MGSQIGSFKILQDLAPGKKSIAQAISLDVLQKNTQQLLLFVLRLTLQISKKKFLNEHRLLYIFCKKALHPYAHFCSSTYCILNILWSLFAKLQHSWYIINRYKVQIYYSLLNIMVYINIALKAKKIQWSKYILQLYCCPAQQCNPHIVPVLWLLLLLLIPVFHYNLIAIPIKL